MSNVTAPTEEEMELERLREENRTLRRLLWIRHDPAHSSGLYGDDGEMQCGACLIDFKRMSAHNIERVWVERAKAEFFADAALSQTKGGE